MTMRRREIKARSITQSNDASCHGGAMGPIGRKRMKRQSSKIVRQAIKAEDAEIDYYDPLKPNVALLCKLGSAIVHAEEFFSADGHEVDIVAFDDVLNSPDVRGWLDQMRRMALLPVKRT